MTDKEKLEKIRSEVIWYIHLRNEGLIIGSCGDFEKLLKFIDSMQEEPVSNPIDFEQELYKAFGQVKDFTLCMRIAKRFYDMGKKSREPVNKQNLSNVERTVKDCKEEPVSEDLEKVSEAYVLDDCIKPWRELVKKAFKAGAKWQKAKDESFSKDLGDYINELSKQFQEVSFAKLSRIAVRAAKWQKENLWKPTDGDDLKDETNDM